jgi:uncharacterized membrane protein
MAKKTSKILMAIGVFIIICGFAIMLSSLAYRNQLDVRQGNINGGLFIGIIGSIILWIGDIIRRILIAKSKKSSEIKKRENQNE